MLRPDHGQHVPLRLHADRQHQRRPADRDRRSTSAFIDNFDALTSTNGRELGTHNIVNDLSWVKGDTRWKFGTNLRFMRNDATNNVTFHIGIANGSWVAGVGRRYMPGGACPAPADCSGLPAVATGVGATPIRSSTCSASSRRPRRATTTTSTARCFRSARRCRRIATDEYEFYVQDSWKLRDNLTVHRRPALQPLLAAVREQRPAGGAGRQARRLVRRSASRTRRAGIPVERERAHHVRARRPGERRARLLRVGQEQLRAARRPWPGRRRTRLVLRGGYSMVYDRIGAGLATSFDAGGSFGLVDVAQQPGEPAQREQSGQSASRAST